MIRRGCSTAAGATCFSRAGGSSAMSRTRSKAWHPNLALVVLELSGVRAGRKRMVTGDNCKYRLYIPILMCPYPNGIQGKCGDRRCCWCPGMPGAACGRQRHTFATHQEPPTPRPPCLHDSWLPVSSPFQKAYLRSRANMPSRRRRARRGSAPEAFRV